jgi:cytochrome c-type biogenesis protein CcmH/NrfG
MDRIAQLNEILAENPSDVFARYSLAMEYANSGKPEIAVAEFRALLAEHPGYVPAYQMLAQTLIRAGNNLEAHEVLCTGIETATRSGNAHAKSEMEGMLAEIG